MHSAAKWAIAIAIGLCAIAPGEASAAPPTPRDAARVSARAAMEEGNKLRDRGDLPGALEAYKKAEAIADLPTAKLAIARTYVALGKLLEGREAALKSAFVPPASDEPQIVADARASAEILAEELATRIPTLTLFIVGAPADQEPDVRVDDVPLAKGTTKSPRKLNPGRHTAVARLNGREAKGEITLGERESKTLTLDLNTSATPAAAAPPAAASTTSPAAPPDAKAGGSPSPLLWVGLGITVLGAGFGTASGIVSIGHKSDADKSCVDGKCPPQAHDSADSAKTWATLSTTGFVAAAVGLGIAGVGLAVGPSKSAAAPVRVRVQPTVGWGAAGVAGSF